MSGVMANYSLLDQYTEPQFLNALRDAKANGAPESTLQQIRQVYQAWMREKTTKESNPTAGMSMTEKVMSNLGAGMTDVGLGVKQVFGQASGADAREKAARDRTLAESQPGGAFTQGVGTAAVLAPVAAIPGANTILGAGAIGAGTGAVMPTTSDNVLGGKALNAGVGAAVGAATQAGAQAVAKYAPVAYNAVADWYAKHGLPFSSDARREAIAGRAFVDALPDPNAARLKLMGFQESVPGVQTSAAAALEDPALLAAERAARETAGPASNILRSQEMSNNAARWNTIQTIKGDPEAIKTAAWDWFGTEAAKLKPRGAIDPKGTLVFNVDALVDRYSQSSPSTVTALGNLREALANGLEANNGKGSITVLHDVRMLALDDTVQKIAQNDSKTASVIRRAIDAPGGIRDQLDGELNRVTSGRWGKLMSGYADRIRPVAQTEAANELVQKMSTKATTLSGEPIVTSSMTNLRAAAQNPPADRFNTPTYTPQAANTISTVTADAERQLMPFKKGVGPAGSATAANLIERGPGSIMDVLRPPTAPTLAETLGTDAAAAGAGYLVGGPAGGVVGVVVKRLGGDWLRTRNEAARNQIAGNLANLLANQENAYGLLETLNPVVRQAVIAHWAQRQLPVSLSPVLGGLSSAYAGQLAGQGGP
jgi:hypothetical protein